MSVTATTNLIEPHGGKLVDRTGPRPGGIEKLEQLQLTSRCSQTSTEALT